MNAQTKETRTLAANTISAQSQAGDVASTIGATSHRVKQFTTAPIEVGAEFCRPSDTRRLFGLGRSYVYELIASGAIRSICLRKPGKKTGLRLLDVASVRSFLQNQFTTDAKD